jgi:hypothetical protein
VGVGRFWFDQARQRIVPRLSVLDMNVLSYIAPFKDAEIAKIRAETALAAKQDLIKEPRRSSPFSLSGSCCCCCFLFCFPWSPLGAVPVPWSLFLFFGFRVQELIDWDHVSRVMSHTFGRWDRANALAMMANWHLLMQRKMRDRPPP